MHRQAWTIRAVERATKSTVDSVAEAGHLISATDLGENCQDPLEATPGIEPG